MRDVAPPAVELAKESFTSNALGGIVAGQHRQSLGEPLRNLPRFASDKRLQRHPAPEEAIFRLTVKRFRKEGRRAQDPALDRRARAAGLLCEAGQRAHGRTNSQRSGHARAIELKWQAVKAPLGRGGRTSGSERPHRMDAKRGQGCRELIPPVLLGWRVGEHREDERDLGPAPHNQETPFVVGREPRDRVDPNAVPVFLQMVRHEVLVTGERELTGERPGLEGPERDAAAVERRCEADPVDRLEQRCVGNWAGQGRVRLVRDGAHVQRGILGEHLRHVPRGVAGGAATHGLRVIGDSLADILQIGEVVRAIAIYQAEDDERAIGLHLGPLPNDAGAIACRACSDRGLDLTNRIDQVLRRAHAVSLVRGMYRVANSRQAHPRAEADRWATGGRRLGCTSAMRSCRSGRARRRPTGSADRR